MPRTAFASLHPVVQLLFFTLVMLLTTLVFHPVLLLISFAGALGSVVHTGRRKALRTLLRLILPAFVLIVCLHPLFSHAGMTILCYLPDDNPLTLESILYGTASAVMFCSLLMWCMLLRYSVSSDGLLYIFGRFTPRLGLLLSMIFRFIPQFSVQFRRVRAAQHCLGRDINQGHLLRRFRNALRILSCVIGWAMEHSVETADALSSRGYGTARRTFYSPFRMTVRDWLLLVLLLCGGAVVIAAYTGGWLEYYFYPMLIGAEPTVMLWAGVAAAAAISFLPLLLNIREERKWNALRSAV